MLKQEVIDSASQSINKLITASNIAKSMEEMANQVDIEKIAIEAMMPKIEEWLNNNLSELVEKIVREEISKIIPQNNPQQTIDVSCAGDTFVAAFVLDYYSCLNVVKAIDYANQMASNVVSKRGVAIP